MIVSFVRKYRSSLVNSDYVLTNISIASILWDIDKQCRPDQTPHNAASGQVIYCLLTECFVFVLLVFVQSPKQPMSCRDGQFT